MADPAPPTPATPPPPALPEPALPAPAPGSDPAPPGLLEAVADYERALMADDVDALARFFAPGPGTLRGDAAGVLVGHDAITAFRTRRGGAPARTITALHVRTLSPVHAVVVAETAPRTGGRGQMTQVWRLGERWAVEVAHVSGPAPAIDPTVWRVVGAPLVLATRRGSLDGVRVAVKDLLAVAGHPIGAGVPAWLTEAAPERAHAPALAALLDAGAVVGGIARTDELAYSLAGQNPHHGTPPNPAAPGRLPGGSTSGPASAVALGQADLGIGTDTAGSIRVPASYQGLWGLRTTHGAVPVDGVLPLAPSFDTVGWLARDAATLRAAAVATLGDPPDAVRPGAPAVDRALLAGLQPGVAGAVADAADVLGADDLDLLGALAEAGVDGLPGLVAAFRAVQASEAWRSHGAWVTAHPGALGDDVAARFVWAAGVTRGAEEAARAALARVRDRVEALLGDRVLLLPSAASGAPHAGASGPEADRVRAATLEVTVVAVALRRPGLSVPVLRDGGLPLGLGLVGPRGSDVGLVDLGADVARQLDRAT